MCTVEYCRRNRRSATSWDYRIVITWDRRIGYRVAEVSSPGVAKHYFLGTHDRRRPGPPENHRLGSLERHHLGWTQHPYPTSLGHRHLE